MVSRCLSQGRVEQVVEVRRLLGWGPLALALSYRANWPFIVHSTKKPEPSVFFYPVFLYPKFSRESFQECELTELVISSRISETKALLELTWGQPVCAAECLAQETLAGRDGEDPPAAGLVFIECLLCVWLCVKVLHALCSSLLTMTLWEQAPRALMRRSLTYSRPYC